MKEHGPEWQHVVIVEDKDKGSPKVQCLYCDKQFVGGAVRIREHLHGEKNAMIKPCEKVPEAVIEEMKQLAKAKNDEKTAKRKREALEKATCSKVSKMQGGSQQSLPAMLNNKQTVDEAVARFFYSVGVPFSVASKKHFKEAMTAVSKFGPGYTPPSEFSLRTSLLKKELKNIECEVQSVVLNDVAVTGATLVSDGWSNVRNKPLINYILVCPKGEVFLDSTDTSGEEKSSQYIADEIIKRITTAGPSNVIQVITDSAANCKGSWPIITKEFPHITCGPCTAHCLDLLLEDLTKIDWIRSSFHEGRDIVKFIAGHHFSLALFRQHSTLELLKPNNTRFCTEFVSHSRLIEVKESLQETVVDRNYKAWLQKKPKALKDRGLEISERVMDEAWWENVKTVVKICEPVVSLLRLMDAGGASPAVGKVYFRMFSVLQHIDGMTAELLEVDRQTMKTFINDRWKMLHTDIHSAGFVLDPEYNFAGYSQGINEEVMSGFCNIIEKLFHDSAEKQTLALQQLTKFRDSTGIFSRECVKVAAKQIPAHTWWSTFGGGAPELQQIAVKVLSQVSSSSAAERNWSTYDFIHNKKRNRLCEARARDLVYVHSNLRLIDKISAVDYSEATVQWEEWAVEDSESETEDSASLNDS